jgi:enamine deaminase RidA (YjgF/YER057c/UK114 family)
MALFRFRLPALLLALFLPFLSGLARADEAKVAIGGYDTVAYFSDGKPVPGHKDYEYVWHNLRWRFSEAANRDLFARDPDKYAPQYDGYCAVGMAGVDFAAPHKDTVDPEVWTIVDGKLYLAHGKGPLWDEWKEKAPEKIKQADQAWTYVKEQAEPMVVGPPCRGLPPTVVITTADGKREIIVAGQTALGPDGNLVGNGDMRAQIEQVGRNIEACLQAAGAGKSDIIRTLTYVADKEAFAKYVDIRRQHVAPDTPASPIIETRQLSAPGALVEIQAVAVLK